MCGAKEKILKNLAAESPCTLDGLYPFHACVEKGALSLQWPSKARFQKKGRIYRVDPVRALERPI